MTGTMIILGAAVFLAAFAVVSGPAIGSSSTERINWAPPGGSVQKRVEPNTVNDQKNIEAQYHLTPPSPANAPRANVQKKSARTANVRVAEVGPSTAQR